MFQPAKQHILLIGFSTLLAAFSLASIVFFTDPYTAGLLTHIFFYLSLFLTVLGISVIIGISIRQLLFSGLYITHMGQSFRQAVLISALVTSSLLLQSKGLLYWWVELSLILLLTFIEIFLSLQV
jgi:hypothetical protein